MGPGPGRKASRGSHSSRALGATRRPRPVHVHRLASRGKYGYSNPGYIYLARVIEEISGDPFVSDIDKNILRPLGMTGAYFDRSPYHLAREAQPQLSPEQGRQEPRASLQFPHRDHDRQWRPQRVSARHGHLPTFPPRDAAAERQKSGATLTEPLVRSSLDELMRPLVQTDPAHPEAWRGLGFFIDKEPSRTLIYHAGDQNGFRSLLIFDLDRGQGMVFVQNSVADEPSPAGPVPCGCGIR